MGEWTDDPIVRHEVDTRLAVSKTTHHIFFDKNPAVVSGQHDSGYFFTLSAITPGLQLVQSFNELAIYFTWFGFCLEMSSPPFSDRYVKQGFPITCRGATEQDVIDLAMEIMGYLERHPHSKDTLDGIRTWWLGNDLEHISLSMVEQAIDCLIQNHKIIRESLPDGGAVYSLHVADSLKESDHWQ